ncbi:MAG TPA: hypothetical protein VFE48_25540 [Methylomirabilota bacterium]|jgi:hypothetical protein|nr:hypothetical protein [Methylomirabilota bacterium]
MLTYWLDVDGDGWRGWACTHDGRRYREWRVWVRDLAALPASARVYLAGARWRREMAA